MIERFDRSGDPAGLANDDEAHDNGLLGSLVLKECLFAQAIHKATGILRGLWHVLEVISQSAIAHTGQASANT